MPWPFFLQPFQFLLHYISFIWHYTVRVTDNHKQIKQITCTWELKAIHKADPSSISNVMHRTNTQNIHYNYTNPQTVSKSFYLQHHSRYKLVSANQCLQIRTYQSPPVHLRNGSSWNYGGKRGTSQSTNSQLPDATLLKGTGCSGEGYGRWFLQ
jgi:hypothetical protein